MLVVALLPVLIMGVFLFQTGLRGQDMARTQPNPSSHCRTCYGFIWWQANAKHPGAVKSLLSRNPLVFECGTVLGGFQCFQEKLETRRTTFIST